MSTGHSASHVGDALGFEGDVHKSGYLVKRAKKSGSNWKKRYFVLNGSSLIYYESHTKLSSSAKGNVLITSDFVVRDVSDPKYPHCFEIVSAFETLRIAAETDDEVEQWKEALRLAVSRLDGTTRGFLQLKSKSRLGSTLWIKKFFVIHSNAVTYHADHFATHKNQGSIRLGARTRLIQENTIITLRTGSQDLSFQCKDLTETESWVKALHDTIDAVQSRDDLAEKVGKENNEQVIMDGFLGTADEAIINDNDTRASAQNHRSSSLLSGPNGSLEAAAARIWPDNFYALTQSALYQAKTAECTEATGVFLISPTCAVFETTLRPYSFELVTPQGVLHVHAQSNEDRDTWTTALRAAIRRSSKLVSDPLVDAAKNIPLDQYQLTFETKQPLGIVLERSAEWALVKSCRAVPSAETNEDIAVAASTGSALIAINGESCLLKSYADVIKSLTGWQPPLNLTFARAPRVSGWLSKRARGRSGRSGRGNWKQRYVEVAEGKLAYYTDDVSEASDDVRDSSVRGALFLMGCAVALAPKGPETDDQPFCFRLVSGIGVIVFQAETLDDLLRWATTLYHGIALANGGGYILEMERLKAETAGDTCDTEKDVASEPAVEAEPEADEAVALETEAECVEPEAEPEPEVETQPEAALIPEPEVEAEDEPAPEAAVEPEPEVASEPDAESTNGEPEAESSPEAVDAADSEPEVEAEAEPTPEAELNSTPEGQAEVATEGEPSLEAQPDREAEAEPAPVDAELAEKTATPSPSRRRFSSVVENQEAVLPPETKPSTPALLTPHRDHDDEEDDDDDESVRASEVVVDGAKISATKNDVATPAKTTIEEIEEILESGTEVLTDEELENTFTLLSNDKEYLNPMQFISLLRSVGLSDHGNLKFELDLFHAFDVRKEGHITKEEFVQGMHKHMDKDELQQSEEMRKIVLGIRNFQHQGTVEL